MPLRSVYKMVNQVYADKLKADAADDRDNNPRQSMPEYLYDWFISKHGIRVVAEGNLVSLVKREVRPGGSPVPPRSSRSMAIRY